MTLRLVHSVLNKNARLQWKGLAGCAVARGDFWHHSSKLQAQDEDASTWHLTMGWPFQVSA